MDAPEPQFLEVGAGGTRRRIAYRWSGGRGEEPQLLWLPGFLSDLASTKALAVAEWAYARGLPIMRFDYSGHGLSSGDFLQASIGDWLEEAIAVWGRMGDAPRIVIGSSMGGWIALLLARHLAKQGRNGPLAGLVLIAPAWDMTEALIWQQLPAAARREIEVEGVSYLPSAYGDPYPVTRRLIAEGRSHLLQDHHFDPSCPVRILQGMRDADVPFDHVLALVDLLQASDVELTLVKDGDHRLSRPEDLRRLTATIAALVERAS
ncbi:MAG: alpha/beta hydrolase [Methyloceanibacter sp.]|jgi:pimeloyl-ACP methyl ester carboxylesterase